MQNNRKQKGRKERIITTFLNNFMTPIYLCHHHKEVFWTKSSHLWNISIKVTIKQYYKLPLYNLIFSWNLFRKRSLSCFKQKTPNTKYVHPSPIMHQLVTDTKIDAHGTPFQYCFGVKSVSFASMAICCSFATTPKKVYKKPRAIQLSRPDLNNSNSIQGGICVRRKVQQWLWCFVFSFRFLQVKLLTLWLTSK